ncbi:transcriptional regulator : : Trans_reg_C [Gemmata massiliana]|uniref:Transcriptional regulator:: Trans_reg_C n=2 Tax=Gemmata massiliana TaxID=1210884 RepID=A0A6P2D1Q4_9BACT|nr:transcriptional regulator : : Trans_reg_C [Gemmata massiliana]
MPSVGRSLVATKVTLATPYVIEGPDLVSGTRLEAVVWVLSGDADGARFIDDAGVYLADDRVTLPADPALIPRLACRFAEPEGARRYQHLVSWEVLKPGSYPVAPVVIANAPAIGLQLDDAAHTATRNGHPLKLGRVEFPIIRELVRAFPSRVSVQHLRDNIPGWDPYTDLTAIRQAISWLRKRLKSLDLTVSDQDGERGWALLIR